MDEGARVYMRGVWPETRWDNLATVVQRVSTMGRFDVAGIAAAGVWTSRERLKLKAVFSGCAEHVFVFSDAEAGLAGAFAGHKGVLVIAGTGSVGLAMTEKGIMRVGGHGHLIGDPGSGFWFGRAGLDAGLRAREGLGPATALSQLLPPDIRPFILSLSHTKVAALAPKVFSAAHSGDEVARLIVEQGLDYLVNMVLVLLNRAGEKLPVSYQGGLFGNRFFLRRFKQRLGDVGIDLVHPAFSGSWGAGWLALTGLRDR